MIVFRKLSNSEDVVSMPRKYMQGGVRGFATARSSPETADEGKPHPNAWPLRLITIHVRLQQKELKVGEKTPEKEAQIGTLNSRVRLTPSILQFFPSTSEKSL